MREPPLGGEDAPDPLFEIVFDEILAEPTTEALLLGLYEFALPALKSGFERYRAETNPLTDSPSVRVGRFALFETEDMTGYGTRSIASLVRSTQRQPVTAWLDFLGPLLEAAGGLDGTGRKKAHPEKRMFSAQPYRQDLRPQRDARFPDPYNMGSMRRHFYDENISARDKTLIMYYKRLREIDVPEMMATIIRETPNQPWGYYLDLTRQLWDEARHATMGEVEFVRLGLDWGRLVRVNFTWSLALNTQLRPKERHAMLYFIEQGLMPKNGKRYDWTMAIRSGDPFSRLCQDFDWADEVLHARIGRDWYVSTFAQPKEAVSFGDRNWSRVLIDWKAYRTEGLTEHHNWWPELYRAACAVWGQEPDPRALAFDTSYVAARADLKPIAASG